MNLTGRSSFKLSVRLMRLFSAENSAATNDGLCSELAGAFNVRRVTLHAIRESVKKDGKDVKSALHAFGRTEAPASSLHRTRLDEENDSIRCVNVTEPMINDRRSDATKKVLRGHSSTSIQHQHSSTIHQIK